MIMAKCKWPHEKRAEAIRLSVEGGLSASQIAARLGVTRNAVIGVLHRAKVARRDKNDHHRIAAIRRLHRRQRAARAAKPASPKPERPLRYAAPVPEINVAAYLKAEAAVVPPETAVTIDELQPGMCRWVYGDPRRHRKCYCGKPALTGAWCADHFARVYPGAIPVSQPDVSAERETEAAE